MAKPLRRANVEAAAPASGASPFHAILELLGGPKRLKAQPLTSHEVHALLTHGLPSESLQHIIVTLTAFDPAILCKKAFGISYRTYQRIAEGGRKRLDPELSSRIWQFADVVARATILLGSSDDAVNWMQRPAIGLNGQVPLDLMSTSAGVKLVEQYLDRLDFGVYT